MQGLIKHRPVLGRIMTLELNAIVRRRKPDDVFDGVISLIISTLKRANPRFLVHALFMARKLQSFNDSEADARMEMCLIRREAK
jgi:hypothetical protein